MWVITILYNNSHLQTVLICFKGWHHYTSGTDQVLIGDERFLQSFGKSKILNVEFTRWKKTR